MRTFTLALLLVGIPALAPVCATALESRLVHEGDVDYRVVTVDLRADALDLYWLDARGVQPVFETDTARLAGVPSGRIGITLNPA